MFFGGLGPFRPPNSAKAWGFFLFPSSRYGRKNMGFSGCRGGKNFCFHKSHGCKKMTSAAEGGLNFLAFFFVQNQDFSGKITSFGAFQNPTDVRFRAFPILADVSFGENEMSTHVRFREFFLGKIERRGTKTKRRLSCFWPRKF